MIGPQRAMPSSVAQINAQVKQVKRSLHTHRLYQGSCFDIIPTLEKINCIFADPPDNIGLAYDGYNDKLATDQYVELLDDLVEFSCAAAEIVWISFNAKWTFEMGRIFSNFLDRCPDWEGKACQQVFTFGQHNKNDLGNNHRPLWRLKRRDAPLYPDQIKVPSWRQRNGDKRAAPGGRVPGDVLDFQYPEAVEAYLKSLAAQPWAAGITERVWEALLAELATTHPGDVMDFPRVTGNSKQRCDWHPTQLHEELVQRCILLSTAIGDRVLDPFGGTGTTLRACKAIGRDCTLIELDPTYCGKIVEAHPDLQFISS